MKKVGLISVLFLLVFAIAGFGWAASSSGDASVVSGIADQTPEQIREHWTPARIAEALQNPMDLTRAKKGGHLRGCIGHIVGMVPLFQGVIQNAVNACARDHRFRPVQASELADITVEVSVLSPLTRARSYHSIIPGWHGVVLRARGRQAVFLPQVAVEQNWSREEMLSQLARKAGLSADAWKVGATFDIFEAQIIPE